MQHTSCTEDRIHHALERCLHGLSRRAAFSSTWTAGLCLNSWSLQELVSRDPANFLILLEKILQQTREAQEKCEYDLLTPLAVMFYSTVLCTPHFPPASDLLQNAIKTFHSFLTWPEPYCNIYQELLAFISEELKAPGISYQRLVRAEQGLTTADLQDTTITVLLMNPTEIQNEFLSVAENLSRTKQCRHGCYITLIKHVYQSCFGAMCDLSELSQALQSKTLDELAEIFSNTTEALETAVVTQEAAKARERLQTKLKDIGERAGFSTMTGSKKTCKLETFSLPIARCHTYCWEQDNFDILNDVFLEEHGIFENMTLTDEVNEEEDDVETDGCLERDSVISALSIVSEDSLSSVMSAVSQESARSSLSISSKNSMKSFVSSLSDYVDSGYVEDSDENSAEPEGKSDSRELKMQKAGQKLTKRFYQLFQRKNHLALKKDSKYLIDIHGSLPCSTYPSTSLPLSRAKSLCNPDGKDRIPARSKRSHSLPQQTISSQIKDSQLAQNVSFNRRPFLSFDEDGKSSTLRVIVFGSDRISGKVARAYSNLRLQESKRPLLTKYFKLQFFYVPVKRNCLTSSGPLTNHCPVGDTPPRHPIPLDTRTPTPSIEESTNDISHYIGMLDPWYKRNILGLMNLSTAVLCQQSSKPENESPERPKEQLPILADMILYYCRFATRPVLLQLYQAELTFDGGEKKTEVFIHSLELGHSAATRAIKASGPGSKRLGIDGDREAIPLTLQIVYSKTTVSGRSRWNNGEKVCTSVNLSKACTKYEELDSKMECLNLTVTEVVKRQNSKSKKSFNQISVSQIKIDKAQVIGVNNCTFAVCLDQDERKILQNVVRCEVSPCYKPESMETRQLKKPLSYHFPQNKSDFCSLLCLPIVTFSGALP